MLQRKFNFKLHHLGIVNLCVGCVQVCVPMLQSAATTHVGYVYCILKHITAHVLSYTNEKVFTVNEFGGEGSSSAGASLLAHSYTV